MKVKLNENVIAKVQEFAFIIAETNEPLKCCDVECLNLNISCSNCILNKKKESYKPVGYYDIKVEE